MLLLGVLRLPNLHFYSVKNCKPGSANVTLTTLSLNTVKKGTSDILISVTRMDNEGQPIDADVQNSTLNVKEQWSGGDGGDGSDKCGKGGGKGGLKK